MTYRNASILIRVLLAAALAISVPAWFITSDLIALGLGTAALLVWLTAFLVWLVWG